MFRRRIKLTGTHGDFYREALVMGPGQGLDGITLDVESVGLRFNVRLTIEQARELGAALTEAAGPAKEGA